MTFTYEEGKLQWNYEIIIMKHCNTTSVIASPMDDTTSCKTLRHLKLKQTIACAQCWQGIAKTPQWKEPLTYLEEVKIPNHTCTTAKITIEFAKKNRVCVETTISITKLPPHSSTHSSTLHSN